MNQIQTIDPNWVNVTARAETITPAIAAEWLSKNVNNRPLTRNQVKYYARLMREGRWKINGESICFGNDGVLLNGQHRLSAVVEAQVPIASVVTRGIEPDAFGTYDGGLNRKIADIFATKGILNYSLVSSIVSLYLTLRMTSLSIMSSSGAINATNARYGENKKEKLEILEAYYEDPEFYQEVGRIAIACYARLPVISKNRIGAYMAFLIKDKHHDFEQVSTFFKTLTSLDANDFNAISLLRGKLVKNRMKEENMRMSPLYIQQLLIKTWNNYIEGRDLKILKWDEATEGKLQFK